jgi:hypothetical protein
MPNNSAQFWPCTNLDVLPFGRLWYGDPEAIDYAKFFSRLHDAVIRLRMKLATWSRRTSTRMTSKNGVRVVAELGRVRRTDEQYRDEADMRRGYWVTFYRSVSNPTALADTMNKTS